MSAEYVAAMEDVLDVYAQPYQAEQPVVCFDETSKQLTRETRLALPTRPGCPKCIDYEYERNGTRNLFMMVEPLAGWRHVVVTEHRTLRDFAEMMRYLTDVAFPKATCIRVVLDNLNTHRPAALYEAFPPEEARRILTRLEFHYTPKHGSWLNMAELELGIFSRQCLNRAIPDETTLKSQVAALEFERNGRCATLNWQFTTPDARIKLHALYPSHSDG